MGQGRVEKLPRSGWVRRWIIGGLSRKHRRWLKRRLHRLRRLAERRDPESAGTKTCHFTRGWDD